MKKAVKLLCLLLSAALLTLFLSSCVLWLPSDETYRTDASKAFFAVSNKLAKADSSYALMAAIDGFDSCYKRTATCEMRDLLHRYAYFCGLLYQNRLFPLYSEPLTVRCDYVNFLGWVSEHHTVTVFTAFDGEKGLITTELYGVADIDYVESTPYYLRFEIEYDFDGKALGDFAIDLITLDAKGTPADKLYSCRYRSGILLEASETDFGDRLSAYIREMNEAYCAPFLAKAENASEYFFDFSEEYTAAMDKETE